MSDNAGIASGFLVFVLGALGLVGGCDVRPEPYIVAGTESVGLRKSWRGWVVSEDDDRALIAVSLPGLSRQVVHKPLETVRGVVPFYMDRFPYFYAAAGPDEKGRIAYVKGEIGSGNTHHWLMVVNMDGTGERQVFERTGDAIWSHVISEHIALSRTTGQVAMICGMKGVQMPGAYLLAGNLEICDIGDGSVRTVVGAVVDENVSWFPDDERVAYVAMMERDKLPITPDVHDGFVADLAGWDRLPVVCVVDLRSGKSTPIHVGWRPVVANDGRSLVLSDLSWGDCRWRRVSMVGAAEEAVSLPSGGGLIYAVKGNDAVLFSAAPTKGAVVEYTKGYSPLVGPRQLPALKVGILNTNWFETVLGSFDFREPLSYGLGRAGMSSK